MAASEPPHQVSCTLLRAVEAEQGITSAVDDAGDSGSKTKLSLFFSFQIGISTLSCASCHWQHISTSATQTSVICLQITPYAVTAAEPLYPSAAEAR